MAENILRTYCEDGFIVEVVEDTALQVYHNPEWTSESEVSNEKKTRFVRPVMSPENKYFLAQETVDALEIPTPMRARIFRLSEMTLINHVFTRETETPC